MAIRPVKSRFKLEVLTEGQVSQVQNATAKILSTVGMQIRSDEMLKILGQKGARIDEVSGRVFFAPELLKELTDQVPTNLHFGARDPENDLY